MGDTGAATAAEAQDAHYMRRALALARRGRRAHPNPMVGAVLVKNGRVVGEGWHERVGEPHAETMAFASAPAGAARGATLYVTLEPCAHTVRSDGTPRIPCAARCLDAGVARVVCAMEDPDPRVAGRGFERLRAAGVEVVVGVREVEARELNRAYVKHRTTGLPFILHKAAMTFDGKICAPGGDSRWVTGEAARAHVHRLRNRADALIVGIGTVLADDPSLTTRLPGRAGRNAFDPLRVIIDSRLETPPTARVLRALADRPPGVTRAATLVIGAEGAASEARKRDLEAAGADVALVPPDARGRVDLTAAMRLVAERYGALHAILEGGGELAAGFWEAGLVDRALFFVAPKVIGGRGAKTPVEGEGLSSYLSGALLLGTIKIRRFGPDIAMEADVAGKDGVTAAAERRAGGTAGRGEQA
jgi:riboflavin biosynthesis protein RibD